MNRFSRTVTMLVAIGLAVWPLQSAAHAGAKPAASIASVYTPAAPHFAHAARPVTSRVATGARPAQPLGNLTGIGQPTGPNSLAEVLGLTGHCSDIKKIEEAQEILASVGFAIDLAHFRGESLNERLDRLRKLCSGNVMAVVQAMGVPLTPAGGPPSFGEPAAETVPVDWTRVGVIGGGEFAGLPF